MGAPLIPYIKIPEIPLPFPKPVDSIKPFGVLVATGVYLGAIVAIRRARQRGVNVDKMNTFIFYVVGIGFIGAHVFDAIFYTPEKIRENALYLLNIPAGLSSYGGFLGAILGLFLYKWRYKEDVLQYAEPVCSAFPLAWVFGRAGCASVHDHPGRLTDSWLGVQYHHPDVNNSDKWGLLWDAGQTMGRFDLGLIEMVLTIPLAVAFHFLWKKKPRNYGFFAGWMSIAYAPIRFVLDFFRIEHGDKIGARVADADPRHFGLTPAQWACFGLLAIGWVLIHNSRLYPAPASWSEVKPWDPDAPEGDEDEEEEAEPKKGKASKPAATKASALSGEARTAERRKRRRRDAGAAEKPAEKPKKATERAEEKPAEKPAEKAAEKPAEKSAEQPAAKAADKKADEAPASEPDDAEDGAKPKEEAAKEPAKADPAEP